MNVTDELADVKMKIDWFTQRLTLLRVERQMCLMTLGAQRLHSEPMMLEGVYIEHLRVLNLERAAIESKK